MCVCVCVGVCGVCGCGGVCVGVCGCGGVCVGVCVCVCVWVSVCVCVCVWPGGEDCVAALCPGERHPGSAQRQILRYSTRCALVMIGIVMHPHSLRIHTLLGESIHELIVGVYARINDYSKIQTAKLTSGHSPPFTLLNTARNPSAICTYMSTHNGREQAGHGGAVGRRAGPCAAEPTGGLKEYYGQ